MERAGRRLAGHQARGLAVVLLVAFGGMIPGHALAQTTSTPPPANPPATPPPVTLDSTKKNELTPAQLAQLLGLNQNGLNCIKTGCVGITAALQGQTAQPTTAPSCPSGFQTYAPESVPGTTAYATKAAADAAAAAAQQNGSSVVEFQKQGAQNGSAPTPAADGSIPATSVTNVPGNPGAFDYVTVVNIGGTTYYVDASHADTPSSPMTAYATTTQPSDPTTTQPAGAYTASMWCVTVKAK